MDVEEQSLSFAPCAVVTQTLTLYHHSHENEFHFRCIETENPWPLELSLKILATDLKIR